ncbi:hypothetical protein ACVWY3_003142 [Bradyrhizobium sp. USDA 4486]
MSQTTTYARAAGAAKSAIETSTIRAISWRLIPFLVLAYFFSYLDRVNLGFAALTMNADLKFTPLIFSWGAGIFFIGYFIFEVPSNLALEKFGASRWIARIMVTWGIISALMAMVGGVTSFYVLRFLLGVAEAGFFPGIILYLTYWYPAEYRARFLAAFAIAVPVSTVIGAPISGLLLGLDGMMGLKGWQWLFILEGIPSVLLGIVTWFYLTDRPEKADWLSAEQKAWLKAKLDAEIAAKQAVKHLTLGEALSSPKVITLSLIYFGFVGALYGMQFWLPQIVKAVRPHQRADRLRDGDSLCVRHDRDDPVGAAFGRHARARDACRRAHDPDRHRARHLLLSHRSGHDDGGIDLRRHRSVLRLRRVLDPADRLAFRYGRGRGHRPDQFDRQSRRLRRPVSDRLGQGSDGADLDGSPGACRAPADRRHPGLRRRPREQARVRRNGAISFPFGGFLLKGRTATRSP